MSNTLLQVLLSQTPCQKIELRLLQLKAVLLNKSRRHPLPSGQIFKSPGGTFKYRVVGACCQLYDRACLPFPCCSLSWHGKQPSWRLLGKRFVPDTAAKQSPSYCVQLVDYPDAEPFVMTLYWMKLSPQQQAWWYTKRDRLFSSVRANCHCLSISSF